MSDVLRTLIATMRSRRVSLCVWKRVQRHVVVALEAKELVDERAFELRKAIGEGGCVGELGGHGFILLRQALPSE